MRYGLCVLLVAGGLVASAAAQRSPSAVRDAAELRRLAALGPFPACGQRLVDQGAAGGGLVVVERDGRVRSFAVAERASGSASFEVIEATALQLRDARSALLDFGDLTLDGRPELVVVDGGGASFHSYAPADGFGAAQRLARRARNELAVGEPRLLDDLVFDLIGDGRVDLILPGLQATSIWSQASGDGPELQRGQSFPVDVDREWDGDVEQLTDQLSGSVRVPALDLRDLNGDRRLDLVVVDDDVHSFYIQDAQGRFAETPIQVDLKSFVDTTPQASLALGETLVAGDRQQLRSGDVNGDGIPDYVIGHRRKVWTFLGTAAGPQFQRPSVVRVGTDLSAFVLVDLNDDDRSDLLLFRVEVPSAASLAVGLVSSIDIEVRVAGHAASERGRFGREPLSQRTLTLRTPPLLSLLDRVDELADRVVELIGKARIVTAGEIDDRPGEDVAVVSASGDRLELWRSDAQAERDLPRAQRQAIRQLVFEDPDPVFDIDRLLDAVGLLVDARAAAIVGSGAPTATLVLRDPEQFRIIALETQDLDGDGRDELLVVYEDALTGRQRWFDLLGF